MSNVNTEFLVRKQIIIIIYHHNKVQIYTYYVME